MYHDQTKPENRNATGRTGTEIERKYGWKKQKDDVRDYGFGRMVRLLKMPFRTLPSSVSNRPYCSAIQDQGQLGSCTANAWAGLLQYNENRNGQGGKQFKWVSRLFVYYNERVLEGTVNEDSGAELRDGAKCIHNQGACWEYQWPYNESKFAVTPTKYCYAQALPHVINNYYALNTITDMKTCLASGQCFVFGFNVYDSFESQEMADTGVLKMPTKTELSNGPIGGHAVMCIGYDDGKQVFTCKNSWGLGWGLPGKLMDGYFTMPYQYITNQNYASDFWTVVKDV